MSSSPAAIVQLNRRTARAIELVEKTMKDKSWLQLPELDQLAWARTWCLLIDYRRESRERLAAMCAPWFEPEPAELQNRLQESREREIERNFRLDGGYGVRS